MAAGLTSPATAPVGDSSAPVSALQPPAPAHAAAVTVINVASAAAPPPAAPPSIKGRRDFYPVLLAGVCLTAVAGFINATFMISTFSRAVSHMTGLTTRVGVSMLGHDINYFEVVQCLITIAAFVTGSLVCGVIIGSEREFKRVRAYGVALIVQSIVLFVAVFIPPISGYELPVFLGAFACGLQNGLVSTFSSAIIRTTHVTGLLTDIGVLMGQGLRWWLGRGPQQKGIWKLKIFIPLYFAFMLGAIAGTPAAMQFGIYALLFPASLLLLAGLSHVVFRTMALDTVKRKGMKVEVLDADSTENPGYFAALEAHPREPRRGAPMVEAGMRRVDTTMGLLDDMNMVDFMAETPKVKQRMSSTMGILQPAYYAAPSAAQPHHAPVARATTLAGMIDAGKGGASRSAKNAAVPMLQIRIPGSTSTQEPSQAGSSSAAMAAAPGASMMTETQDGARTAAQPLSRAPSPPSPSPRMRPTASKGKDLSLRPNPRAYTRVDSVDESDVDDEEGGLVMRKSTALSAQEDERAQRGNVGPGLV